MAVASEIRGVGSFTPISRTAGQQIGTDVVLPVGTRWAVTFGSTTVTTAVTAATVGAAELFDSTNAALICTLTAPGLIGSTGSVSNGGAPLALIDATAGAITVQARAGAANTAAETLNAHFTLEQIS